MPIIGDIEQGRAGDLAIGVEIFQSKGGKVTVEDRVGWHDVNGRLATSGTVRVVQGPAVRACKDGRQMSKGIKST